MSAFCRLLRARGRDWVSRAAGPGRHGGAPGPVAEERPQADQQTTSRKPQQSRRQRAGSGAASPGQECGRSCRITGVLQDPPTGPDMILVPGGRAGRQTASFPPAGNFIKGDPVGTAGEVQGVDADAVEELFKGVYPKLAGWVRRLVDDDDTAHEIASEAFVRLLSRWTRVDSPQSYLYMIATNLIRDHWRKAERERR